MTAAKTVRLGWLDALRGFAALTVVWFHLSPQMLGSERHLEILRHIDLGKYGVLLFFLVSGYVIPMSLERHGSLRRFWIGRLCRIYPAYLRERLVLAAGATGIGFLLLPALDGHPTRDSTAIASWQGLLFIAVMFAGTVVYRAQSGQLGRIPAAISLTAVTLSVVGAHWTHLDNPTSHRVWPATVGAVTVTFLIAYAMKNRPVPAALTWLGRISYSLYLTHAVVLFLIPRIIPDLAAHTPAVRLATGLAYFAVVLALAWLSYRMVELPGQALGRRLTARLAPPPPPLSPPSVPHPARGGARTGARASRLDT